MQLNTNNFIWHIDGTLTSTTILAQSGPGSNDNEEVLYIPQKYKTKATSSHGLVSYPGHSLGLSYPSAVVIFVRIPSMSQIDQFENY